MLTHKSLEGFLRVAAQKKVDGLPNEDEFVVRRLNYQRSELLGLQEAYSDTAPVLALLDKALKPLPQPPTQRSPEMTYQP